MSDVVTLNEMMEFKLEALGMVPSTGAKIEQFRQKIKTMPDPTSLPRAIKEPGLSIIAEIKKASPSKGQFRADDDYDPGELARAYEQNGAAAISVLTDSHFFRGSIKHLANAREHTALPILRKDLIVHHYQIFEARANGADAILLIAAALDEKFLKELIMTCHSLGMPALVEVHTETDVELALEAEAKLIGINNRNLDTFETDINNTAKLMKKLPDDKIVVSMSGISTPDDIRLIADTGVNAALVGEALMTAPDAGAKLAELVKAAG